jgi:phosphatidylserine/phosphatidylglycerophosphate/cardiolipin synthase-like enzyme
LKYFAILLLSSLILPRAFALEVYFNQNPRSHYTDPYRKITRAGDNLEAVILREINAAKSSIDIAVQEFRLPSVALALVQKQKAGVDVRVVIENEYNFDVLHPKPGTESGEEGSDNRDLRSFVDANQNGRLEVSELENRDAIYILAKGKVPLIDDTWDGSSGAALMHHKFIVVDKKTVVISTANFTLSCVHGDYGTPGSRGNPNSMIVADSVQLGRAFTEEFNLLWSKKFGQNKTYRGPQVFSVGGTKITVQFSPTSRNMGYEKSTNGLIAEYMKKANRSFKAALFVFSEQKLADTLEPRHDQGVDVGVIIEPRFAYRDYSELLDMLGEEMLGANCRPGLNNHPWKHPIREGGMANLPGGDKLHHKFAVIDGKYTLVGSHNWSDSANYGNDETFLVIENTSISDSYTQEYERLKRGATLGLSSKAESDIQKRKDSCARQGLL